MAWCFSDRTPAFLDAAKAFAQRSGAEPSKVATRSLVRRAPTSDFLRAAAAVSAAVAALAGFVAAKRRDYCDPLRCSDAERDVLEAEVAATVADCRQRIDELTQAAPAAAGGEGDSAAHHMGIVVCLAERLTEAASRFDALRAQRAKRALDMKAARRSQMMPAAHPGDGSLSSSQRASQRRGMPFQGEVTPSSSAPALPPQFSAPSQRLALEAEGHALAEELSSFVDQVRAAEATMVQVAALSQTFASHVAAQAAQIEELYNMACESSHNLQKGNAELEKTIRTSAGARKTTAILLMLASFMLLLLDWLSG